MRKSWQAGKYRIFYKQTKWHDDDVRDFTFRTFLPYKVDITLTEFTNDVDYKNALYQTELAAIIDNLAYDKSDSLGFTYRSAWYVSNRYQFGIKGHSSKDCQFTITLTGTGAGSSVI